MVRLRLSRTGRKNAPAYRIMASHRTSKRDGEALEILGFYNPSENPAKFEVNKERYDYWVSVGAQPSKTVAQLVKGTYKYVPYKQPKSFSAKLKDKAASIEEKQKSSDTATE